MSKNHRKSSKSATQITLEEQQLNSLKEEEEEKKGPRIKKLDVVFRTKAQEELWNMIEQKEITICAGDAGTGKSHISLLKALDLLQKYPEKYKKIIITTPIVEADGEKMGFLPGTVEEKMAPYTFSSIYIFKKILGEQKVARMLVRGHIEVMALAFLRGVNIDNSILICEEAQNLTRRTAKTLLTRIGENAKFILNGDLSQSDRVKNQKESGLFFAMEKLRDVPQIGVFEFGDGDIVRNPVISTIIKRFNGDVDSY